MLVAVLAALAAGCAFAVSSLLQQRAARAAPPDESLSPRLLWDLLHRRDWLLGMGSAIASFVLQAVALAFGPISLVQPLIVCELLFALPISVRLRHARMGRAEWAGTLAVAGGLAGFLWAASPGEGNPQPDLVHWAGVLLAVAALTAAAVAAGRMLTGPARASLYALAAGAMFGLQAALTKTATTLFQLGAAHGFTAWQPYALAVVGPLGVLLGQSAYQAGPLAASLPVLDAVEPAVAIMIGAFAFHEPLADSPLRIALQVAGVAVLVAGIVTLDRSELIEKIHADVEDERDDDGRVAVRSGAAQPEHG